MIAAFDISTSITGVTVLDDEGKIVLCEAVDTRNKNHFPTIFHKAQKMKDKLLDLKVEYDIKSIYIEKNLQSFRSGFSSAKTLSVLSSFNGIVSWLCYEIFDIEPQYLAATSARKLCGIKIPRGEKAKPVVLKFLLDNEPSFVIDYTRNGTPKPESYDRADSLVIAKAGAACEAKNSKS